MDSERRTMINEKRRRSYAAMSEAEKDSFLQRRRAQYAARKNASASSDTGCTVAALGTSNVNIQNTCLSTASCSTRDIQSRKAYVNPCSYPTVNARAEMRANLLRGRLVSVTSDEPSTILPEAAPCEYCSAFRFFHEPPSFCCSQGEISLAMSEMPQILSDLFTESDPECIDFQKYVRTYNNNLAFTTFSARKDNDLLKNHQGIYIFKVQGKIHHFLNPLKHGAESPTGIQLYFYDPQTELDERLKVSQRFSRDIMIRLMDILSRNPYVVFLRQLKDLQSVENYQLYLVANPKLDQRVFNEPTCNDVAGIICIGDQASLNPQCHIQIYSENTVPHKICHNYACYDSLAYPLLFTRGEAGWHHGIEKLAPNMRKQNRNCKTSLPLIPSNITNDEQLIFQEDEVLKSGVRKRNVVSCRQYYCYKLQIRNGDKSMLLHSGRLLQQYIVDMFVKIETTRLEYYYKQQKEIRTECFQGLIDGLASGHSSSSNVGKKLILPPSFVGGPRDMRKRYMDAMALVQQFGKPDFFLTMTCNPAWSDITKHLLPNELPQNRPDLLSRVFKSKLELLKKDLIQDQIFGRPDAFVYSIEFQKRGLPHAHILLIICKEHKPLNSEAYDRYISAELPDPIVNPHLHGLVLKHMIHGPCGTANPRSPCMQNNKCKNRFPRQFQEATTHGCDSYPQYRRRDNGLSGNVRRYLIDNRWVVPYNPYLLQKYDCHINVEICSTIKLVKYIYKYIYKGPDKVAFRMCLVNAENEIEEYQRGRWVGPAEAAWRLYSFDLFEMQPAVIALQLHLPNNHYISFAVNQDLQSLISNTFLSRTMLTEFFQMNHTDATATSLQLLYRDFPKYFTWDTATRTWNARKKRKVIGRIVSAGPNEGERYYLRLLLNHVRAPSSYSHLLTYDGQIYATFREAALVRDLLASDFDLDKCLEEAVQYQMPSQLRHLFASILAFCSPSNPKSLWDKYYLSMCDNCQTSHQLPIMQQIEIKRKALLDISQILGRMGRSLLDFHLGTASDMLYKNSGLSREVSSERDIIVSDEDVLSVERLNAEQRTAYNTILTAVKNHEPSAFFVDGPGGTGKTYLYKAIMATLRSEGSIVLATATSGVAACILPGGRTAHSRFKIPVHDETNKIANISKQSATAELIRQARLIIWDEAPMAHREAVEAFAEMLKDITETELPFGNKTVVFGGDFRQVLPVVSGANREEQLDASLFHSPLWHEITQLRLTENMRAIDDPYFATYLLRIGNGTEPEDENSKRITSDKRIFYGPVDQVKTRNLSKIYFLTGSGPGRL